jgi:hypothetical protein
MDLYSNLNFVQSLVPAARTATGNGVEVDIRDYHGAMVVIGTGVITDGTHTIEVKEAAVPGGAFTAVADADLQGTEPAIGVADDNVVFRIGYKGTKGALRVDVTVAGATTGGVYQASVVRGHPRKAPVA